MGSVYRGYSKDGGVTWTNAESLGLVAPVAPSTIARIPKTGDLLIVWNNAPDKRTPLTRQFPKTKAKPGITSRILKTIPGLPMPTPAPCSMASGRCYLIGCISTPLKAI